MCGHLVQRLDYRASWLQQSSERRTLRIALLIDIGFSCRVDARPVDGARRHAPRIERGPREARCSASGEQDSGHGDRDGRVSA